MQNRSVSVLKRVWGALGEDGEISWLPLHTKVREAISLLDQELKTKNALNLDDMVEMLIRPPFGCNIASASMILGVFVSPRKENMAFLFNGREIQISAWLGEVFQGNFIDRKKLKRTEIRYVTETGEWQSLLAMWDMEPTHFGRVGFLKQALELNERIKIPAGGLYEKYKRLEAQAEESYDELSAFDTFLDKEDLFFMQAYEKGNAANLSRVGKDLVVFLDKMMAQENTWMPDQFKQVTPRIEKAKQAVIQVFDDWLKTKSILTPQQIGDFKHSTIDQVGGNLKKLGMFDLHKKLEKHVSGIIARIEERQKVAYIVEEVEAFIAGHRIDESIKVNELKAWSENVDDFLKGLKKAKRQIDVPDIDRLISETAVFKKACKDLIKSHKKRAGKLFDKKFVDLEDIRSTRNEVKELMNLFTGQEADLEDILMMVRQLGQFERDISLWNDFGIPTDELKTSVESRIQEILELQNDEDPPWDVEEVYGDLMNTILEDRDKAAAKWMASVLPETTTVEKMSAQECHHLSNRLNPPAYLTAEQLKNVLSMQEMMEKRLKDLNVEGLLVQFLELSPELQQQFLEKANSYIQKLDN